MLGKEREGGMCGLGKEEEEERQGHEKQRGENITVQKKREIWWVQKAIYTSLIDNRDM